MPATEAFIKAVDLVGGVVKAAAVTSKGQSTISGYLKDGNPPEGVCMLLEVETKGEIKAEDMWPDLAETFLKYREAARSQPEQAVPEQDQVDSSQKAA